MNTQPISHPLHRRALNLFQLSSRIDRSLISVLRKIERQKLHLLWGYQSLFQYCTRCLGMTESQTYTYINVSRTCENVPELQSAVDRGALTVNKANRIASVLKTGGNASFWIEQASTQTQRALELMVANASPEPIKIRERSKPLGNDRVMVVMSMSKAAHARFLRAQDLASRSLGKSATLEQAHEACVEAYLKVQDPVRKAERAVTKQIKKPATCAISALTAKPVAAGFQLKHAIPAAVRHPVVARDKGQCQHKMPGGGVCGATRFTEIHHILPRSRGGQHTLDNLITLCSAHHKALHERMAPSGPFTLHAHSWTKIPKTLL